MKPIALLLILSALLVNCGSSKKVVTKRSKRTEVIRPKEREIDRVVSKKIENIIDEAKKYEGTRYKYGGTTKKGMDCSGLVTVAFQEEDIILPRTTGALSATGDWIDVKELQEGDLVFFATKKNSRRVNHVGIVTTSRPGHVEFIHSTTSRGVIISNLAERYWYLAYVQGRRVL